MLVFEGVGQHSNHSLGKTVRMVIITSATAVSILKKSTASIWNIPTPYCSSFKSFFQIMFSKEREGNTEEIMFVFFLLQDFTDCKDDIDMNEDTLSCCCCLLLVICLEIHSLGLRNMVTCQVCTT